MNLLRKTVVPLLCSGTALLAMFLVCGCQTVETPSSPAAKSPRGAAAHQPPRVNQAEKPANTGDAPPENPDLLRAGDAVSITFSGVERPPEKFDSRIRDDGKIILPLIQAVQAADKTAAQLQDAIHDLYVPTYFNRLTVNVNTEGRYFFVEGEVKQPNRYPYAGQLTVLKSIAAAGDFTDFAKRTKVQIMRVTGKSDIVDCKKAKRNPKLDLPIYPGDIILVPRRLW
ncbi:MAG: polysaccharide biosynthesis/export family protein [Limisphaerales bacterium]